MRPNVRQLEAFKAVMEKGSLSAAARALHISQPAVTKSIRLLEQQLKLQLFVRAGGRLVPSLEAKCLISSVAKIFDHIVIVDQFARRLAAGDAGTFRIAATIGHSQAFLPEAVRKFSDSRPLVDFRFLTLRPAQIIELVASHDIDLGIIYQPADERLREIVLCETDVVCLVPIRHFLASTDVITAEQLRGERLISYVEQSHTGGLLKRLCDQAGMPWSVSITVNQTSTAISMVEAGLGIAVVDSLWVRNKNYAEFVIRPFVPTATLKSRVVYALDRPYSKLYSEFVRSLSAIVGERTKAMPNFFRPPSRASG
jgi:DNA-binding transcriptional LysR family regulator